METGSNTYLLTRQIIEYLIHFQTDHLQSHIKTVNQIQRSDLNVNNTRRAIEDTFTMPPQLPPLLLLSYETGSGGSESVATLAYENRSPRCGVSGRTVTAGTFLTR